MLIINMLEKVSRYTIICWKYSNSLIYLKLRFDTCNIFQFFAKQEHAKFVRRIMLLHALVTRERGWEIRSAQRTGRA